MINDETLRYRTELAAARVRIEKLEKHIVDQVINQPTLEETNQKLIDKFRFPTNLVGKFTIEKHGDGHALYFGRDTFHHGANLAHITETTPECLQQIEDALNARY